MSRRLGTVGTLLAFATLFACGGSIPLGNKPDMSHGDGDQSLPRDMMSIQDGDVLPTQDSGTQTCTLGTGVISCTDDTPCAPFGAVCLSPGSACLNCGTCQCDTHCGTSGFCTAQEVCVQPCSGIAVDAATLVPTCQPRPATCTGNFTSCDCGGVCPSNACEVSGSNVTCEQCL